MIRRLSILALLACSCVSVGQSAGVAGVVEWKCLDGRPGELGLWVDGRYVGLIDPASGDWTFHTGRKLNLQRHVDEFNPRAKVKPAEPVTTVANDRPAIARTENFLVSAPTKADAEAFAELAERERKKLAVAWLGKEMPRWREPCEVVVTVAEGLGEGATTCQFGPGVEPRLSMKIKGSRDYLLANVLPHEVSHCVLATHFRKPVPRWADEGIAVQAESQEVRDKLDAICVKTLNAGRGIALSYLFKLREYPPDEADNMSLYAQGHSITSWLVTLKDRATLLEFVSLAMRDGWDVSAKHFYGFENVEKMQSAWVGYLRAGGRVKEAKAIGSPCAGECTSPCVGACACGCKPEPADSWQGFAVWAAVALAAVAFVVALMRRGR